MSIPFELRLQIFGYLCEARSLTYITEDTREYTFETNQTFGPRHTVIEAPSSAIRALYLTCRQTNSELRHPGLELSTRYHRIPKFNIFVAISVRPSLEHHKLVSLLDLARVEELYIRVKENRVYGYLEELNG